MKSVLVLLFVGMVTSSVAVAKPRPTVDAPLPAVATDPSAPLPVDPGVRVGKLDNGLTYYIERNARPAKRAELRLVVRAGSILEDDDQRGIAHFVEHMAFNGTKLFPGLQLVQWLESTGMRFGAHLNAYTSFDETVYKLQLPTDDTSQLATGIVVLREWAGNVTFDSEECQRERGVVLEEWRLGQGLGDRIRQATMPAVFHGSRYLDRMPIGTESSIQSFDCAAAKRFYTDWYRPDLMAVMVVGDIDPEGVEMWIRKAFSELKNPAPERAREAFGVPDHVEDLVVQVVDRELPQAAWIVQHKVDAIEGQDHASYRKFLRDQMVFIMLNERLGVLGQDVSAPYLAAGVAVSDLGAEREAQVAQILPKDGRELDALRVVLTEIERARRFGFTQGELDRARVEMARSMRDYYSERDKTDSVTAVEELIRVYLTAEPMPGTVYEYAMAQAMLPSFTLAEMSDAMHGFFAPTSRVVEGLHPERAGVVVPDEAAVRAVLADVAAADLAAPEAESDTPPLLSSLPTPGTARRVSRDKKLGISTWRLSNGATVVLKPTDFQAGEVLFEAFSPGGLSRLPASELVPGLTASQLALRSGLGDHDLVTLARILAGHTADVNPFIGRFDEGLYGGAKREDLELMFQLVHLWVTKPRFDATAFTLEQEARRESVANRGASPDTVFEDRWTELEWRGDPRMAAWSTEDVAQMDLARSRAAFADRFGDVSDFTFVVVGSFSEAEILPLIERYVASLPGAGRAEGWADDGAHRLDGTASFELSRGLTPRGLVRIQFQGALPATDELEDDLKVLASFLETRLHEELREARGGTYGVGVDEALERRPDGAYTVRIEFECDPSRIDELIAATWEIVDEVKGTVYAQGAVDAMREKERRSRETDLMTNDWWLESLATAISLGEKPRALLSFDKRMKALSAVDANALGRLVLDKEHMLMGVLRPAASAPASEAAEAPASE